MLSHQSFNAAKYFKGFICENVLRYEAGYVCRAVRKKLTPHKNNKELLLSLEELEDTEENTPYDPSRDWIEITNRGGIISQFFMGQFVQDTKGVCACFSCEMYSNKMVEKFVCEVLIKYGGRFTLSFH